MATLALALATMAPTAALAAWSREPVPAPPGTSGSVLSAVSCPTRTVCVAVGYATAYSGAGVTVAERYAHGRWSVQPTPRPARSSLLFGVSCATANACTAVGSVTGASGRARPLAERWNGSAWSRRPVAAVSGDPGVAYLAGVSCATDSGCTAVGYAGNRSGTHGAPLARRWEDGRWSAAPTSLVPGAGASFLSAVSCPVPDNCTATGFSERRDGTQAALVEHDDGTRWSRESIAHVPGQLDVQLAGVSCAAVGSCVAVGFFTGVTGIDVMLALRARDSTWIPQKPLYPRGARFAQFAGISCVRGSDCVAVGLRNTPAGSDALLAERVRGSRWQIARAPAVPGPSALTAVSCPATSACTAVGTATTRSGGRQAIALRGP